MTKEKLKKGERTRLAIEDAAIELLMEQGYHATSMRQIAERSKLALGGIYNHFKSKDEIFEAIIVDKHPYKKVLPLILAAEGETMEEFLGNAARVIINELTSQQYYVKLMLIEIAEFNGAHGAAQGSYRHKKQSGGRGQFGEVHIRMYPFPRGTNPEDFCTKDRFPSMKEFHYDEPHNFLWVNSVVGGTIPSNFLPAVEKGFKERLERGVIAGQMVQDVAVEVHFGKYHDVDSSEAAFKKAGSMAFRNVFQEARPALLEPIVRMEITVPEAHVGDVYSDMSGRGGRVQGSDAAGGGYQTVRCEVPLREVTTYARTLSSMTGGQGSFTMDFAHYDVMPGNVQQEVISKATMHEEEED
jgi:hypothetical protein